MRDAELAASPYLCPSAPGVPSESVLIGVVTDSDGVARVVPTERALPVTLDLLQLSEPVSPSEVFRFASLCRTSNCVHFKENACALAARSIIVLSEVMDKLPNCPIRSQCRWFRQEGPEMCKRCPQIITDQYRPSDEMLRVVYGEDPPATARETLINAQSASRSASHQSAGQQNS